eukprot:1159454-Pelagomonas_calceolata.AAC.3
MSWIGMAGRTRCRARAAGVGAGAGGWRVEEELHMRSQGVMLHCQGCWPELEGPPVQAGKKKGVC